MLERVDTRHRCLDILPALGRARPDSCVTGMAACSASLPRKSKHGHTWPPPRARVDTVQNRPNRIISPWLSAPRQSFFKG